MNDNGIFSSTVKMANEYSYRPEECDVADKARLQKFRAKRREWVTGLSEDADHNIWLTLTAAVWREVAFVSLAAAADGNPRGALNNPLVREAVFDGHVALQILAIRRLVDNKKNVISLTKLLGDISNNIGLITRENYVAYDGLPYDYAPVAEENVRRLIAAGGIGWGETKGPWAADSSERAHRQFDALSGVVPDQRARDDRIPVGLVDEIGQWIEKSGAEDIARWSHAYLAHAGSESSRQAMAEFGLSGQKIGDAIQALARAAEAISAYLLYDAGRLNALMATPQFDQFEHLDQPAVRPHTESLAPDKWEKEAQAYDSLVGDVGSELEKVARRLKGAE